MSLGNIVFEVLIQFPFQKYITSWVFLGFSSSRAYKCWISVWGDYCFWTCFVCTLKENLKAYVPNFSKHIWKLSIFYLSKILEHKFIISILRCIRFLMTPIDRILTSFLHCMIISIVIFSQWPLLGDFCPKMQNLRWDVGGHIFNSYQLFQNNSFRGIW